MILVDTSVWIDHLRVSDAELQSLLEIGQAMIHPFTIGEIELGHIAHHALLVEKLEQLPQAPVVALNEISKLIRNGHLSGKGIGYVDAHLLGSTLSVAGALLWTRDKRLHAVAHRFGVAFAP